MLGRLRVRVGGVAALVVLSVATTWCPAGIVVMSRQTNLVARGELAGDQFDRTDSSVSFGLYDNTIGDSREGANGGETASASASQTSNITTTSIAGTHTGSASAQVAEFADSAADAASLFRVDFDVVDLPEALTIQGHVQATSDQARVTLWQELASGGSVAILNFEAVGPDRIDFDKSLTLDLGSYELEANAYALGSPVVPDAAHFEMAIATTAIPLPAPLLSGAAMLLLLAAAAGRARFIDRRCKAVGR